VGLHAGAAVCAHAQGGSSAAQAAGRGADTSFCASHGWHPEVPAAQVRCHKSELAAAAHSLPWRDTDDSSMVFACVAYVLCWLQFVQAPVTLTNGVAGLCCHRAVCGDQLPPPAVLGSCMVSYQVCMQWVRCCVRTAGVERT
jgi:hypothetical protein